MPVSDGSVSTVEMSDRRGGVAEPVRTKARTSCAWVKCKAVGVMA
ncbi:hypothetical protein EES42_42940 [Streptomyces sp. ADI95-17]|nr:hypothetical protein EES42_42940 [Streptomyces sp. ADI95-17]